MVGFPAARVGDMHTCPACVAALTPMLPIAPPGKINVLVGKKPAARQTDLCTCVAGTDPILMGSPTVLIGSLPAARMLDPTTLGGVIVLGEFTVLIGVVGVPSVTLPNGLVVQQFENADGSVSTKIGDNITVNGSPEFQSAVARDMDSLYGTPTGKSLIDQINSNPNHKTTIVETTAGNSVGGFTNDANKRADGTNGPGSDTVLKYNPNRTQIGDGSEDWMTRPPAVGLGHELVHVDQAQNGRFDPDTSHSPPDDEKEAAGVPPFENAPHTENKIRREMGQPRRPRY